MPTPIINPNSSSSRDTRTADLGAATGYVSDPAAQKEYAETTKKYQDERKKAETQQFKDNHENQTQAAPNAPLTGEQYALLAKSRKSNTPTFFDSTTGITQQISSETEDSLILLPSSSKRMAAQYLDSLLSASPPKTDYAAILTEAVNQHKTNVDAALTDLDSVVSTFESFKVGMQGSGNALYQAGTSPMLKALSKGFGKVENQRAELKYLKTFYSFCEKRYTPSMTDEVKKEWRSWKRVLVTYA